MAPRSLIPMQNGSTVLSARLLTNGDWQFGVVLAEQEDNTLHPYVVWNVERHFTYDEPWVALHGDYHRDLESAREAYTARGLA